MSFSSQYSSTSSSSSLSSAPPPPPPRTILDDQNLLQFDTLHELQHHACVAFADNPLFGTYVESRINENINSNEKNSSSSSPSFSYLTYREFGEKVKHCRAVLKDLGVQEFSKVGIISNNRWEWPTIAAAAYSLNAVAVPMYEAQRPSDWTYILNDAGCSVLFCSTNAIYERAMADVVPNAPSVQATICLDAEGGEPHAFRTHMEQASSTCSIKDDNSSYIVAPSPDDLANLIYTSGTTGTPKGVELLHSNCASNIHGVRGMTGPSDVSLAFLPWAHSYGMTCELWTGMAHGSSMGICRGIPHILEDLQLVNPTNLLAVPTLYKKVYDGVHNMIESSNPIRRGLMKKALAIGRKNSDARRGLTRMGILDTLQHRVLDNMVLSKIRNKFGSRIKNGFVAGAACPTECIHFFDDVGIPICEGYGLTETSPIIAINRPEDRSPGYVGKAIPGVTIVIMGEDGVPVPPGEEGEICCYGPNVMRGYHKNTEATEEVMSPGPDGQKLFHTGDLGRMTEDGWLAVTGRLKEQYKLENGKYVCPSPIEDSIGMSRFITQVVLCGANRPYNVALIVPDWNAIRSELKISNHDDDDSDMEMKLVNDERVRSLLAEDIAERCRGLKKFEIPRDFAIVAPFTSANNMLTPKMSIRKHVVINQYEDVIESMYGEQPPAGQDDAHSIPA